MDKISYFDLYEKLYKNGYHSNLELSHTKKLFPYLNEISNGNKKIKILDVGCSHGLAVQELKLMGYDAYGIDVSETAINHCQNRGLTTCKLGSATNIPFDDGFFDLIISTDVLEHIMPDDIHILIQEFKRVNKGHCLLSIACDAEGNRQPLEELKLIDPSYNDLENLHTTLMLPENWDMFFNKNGYIKEKMISFLSFEYNVIYKPLN